MKSHLLRRRTALLLTCLLAAPLAQAQSSSYPTRPITWVVPTPPGGILDTVSRQVAAKLAERLGQPVVVDNKAGAGGMIAAEAVARAPADGHTILMGTQSINGANAALFKNMRYDPAKDFVPVHALYEVSPILVVPPSRPYKTVKELVEYARANPGKLNFASASLGSGSHLTAELFMAAAGIKMTHVPFKGSAPALAELIAGRVDVMFDYPVTAMPLIQAGKLTPLAVTSKSRLPALPAVPTITESGFPQAQTVAWAGAFVPAGTPPAAVNRLAEALTAVLRDPEVRAANARVGQEVLPDLQGAEFARFNLEEIARWKALVDATGIRLD